MAGAGGERWVGLATDFSEGSRAALRWAADNLLRASDQLLHVIRSLTTSRARPSSGNPSAPVSFLYPGPMTPSPPAARPSFAC